jgi:K+-sensing histidine kinase KdpD
LAWSRATVVGRRVLAFLTWMCFQLQLGLATTSFVYLIAILLLSLRGSFISSAVLSFIAVACLNYFFAPPIFNFQIDYPQDILLVIAFLLTSLMVTGLVGSAPQADGSSAWPKLPCDAARPIWPRPGPKQA